MPDILLLAAEILRQILCLVLHRACFRQPRIFRRLNLSGVDRGILRDRLSGHTALLLHLLLLLFKVLLKELVYIFLLKPAVDENLLDGTDHSGGNPVDTHTNRKRQREKRGHQRHHSVHGLHRRRRLIRPSGCSLRHLHGELCRNPLRSGCQHRNQHRADHQPHGCM